jgi:hypothetical protein
MAVDGGPLLYKLSYWPILSLPQLPDLTSTSHRSTSSHLVINQCRLLLIHLLLVIYVMKISLPDESAAVYPVVCEILLIWLACFYRFSCACKQSHTLTTQDMSFVEIACWSSSICPVHYVEKRYYPPQYQSARYTLSLPIQMERRLMRRLVYRRGSNDGWSLRHPVRTWLSRKSSRWRSQCVSLGKLTLPIKWACHRCSFVFDLHNSPTL